MIDADGNKTQYIYDALGQQIVSIDPLGNRTTTTYDADGQRVHDDGRATAASRCSTTIPTTG